MNAHDIAKACDKLERAAITADVLEVDYRDAASLPFLAAIGGYIFGMKVRVGSETRVGGYRKTRSAFYQPTFREWVAVEPTPHPPIQKPNRVDVPYEGSPRW